jgi:membrane peptidoglycan carboxypeptidase
MPERAPYTRAAMKRPLPAAAAAVALSVLAAACAIPHPHFRGPVPTLPPLSQTSLVFDRHGRLINELHAGENRTVVPISEVPEQVQQAVISIEDARFYQHRGVDVKAILRAAVADAKAGTFVQGGSTIEEQLVKNTITGDAKTLGQKLRQAELAYALEGRYTKAQILGLYLNTVYFGEGAYGIQAAAQTYFSRDAQDLTLTQGAMLAGVIQAPSAYDPLFDPVAALRRRNTVLTRMAYLGHIDDATMRQAQARPLGLDTSDEQKPYPAGYFVEYVKDWFLANPRFGATRADRYDLLFKGGLRIYTTVDLHMQALAEQAVRSILVARSDPHAAMTVIDPTSGEIRAMVGGRGFFSKDPVAKVNLASGQGGTLCRAPDGSSYWCGRQPGSSFKPFTLVSALEHGISPEQVYAAPPSIEIRQPNGAKWDVTNFEGQSYGSMTLQQATWDSVNTVYAQVVNQIGAKSVVATAKRMGIQSPLEAVPSITLGTEEVNTVEMASAYGTLAAMGYHAPVTSVTKITDATGHLLYRADEKPRLVVNPRIAFSVDRILEGVVQQGTGVQANIPRPAAGKTGSSQNNWDAWFVGFTPQLVAAVWVGYPRGQIPMVAPRTRVPVVLGGTWPAEIWHAFMLNATKGMPVLDFTAPSSRYVTVVVDVTRGCLPNRYTPPQDVQPVRYVAGTEPTSVCTEPDSPQEVAVPQVTGLSEERARAALEGYGFRVVVEPVQGQGLDAGTVLSQSPPSGAQAFPGDTVIIVVVASS